MKKVILILLALFAIHLFLLANVEFTAWPEMFSFPYLKNNGFFLYKDMIHAYPPFLTLLLAYYFKIVGFGLTQLKVFAWSMILVNDLLIFLCLKSLTKNDLKAASGTLFYVLLQPILEGNMLWFDTALVTPLLFALYFLIISVKDGFRKNSYLFISGVFLGIAILTKQTALVFLLFTILFLILNKVSFKKLLVIMTGPLLLSSLLFIRLFQEDALLGFWNWTFYYPATYWTNFPTYVKLTLSKKELAVILLVFSPLAFLSIKSFLRKNKFLILLLLFLGSGILAVYPRFSFYHFQPALATAAIFAGYTLMISKKYSFRYLFGAALIIFILILPTTVRAWQKEARFFGEADKSLAEQIERLEVNEDPIYLLGLHSGLYVLTRKLPPKPWVDNFGWNFEIPSLQEEVINKWKENPPTAIFWKAPEPGNWYDLGTYQPQKITEWIKKNYTMEGEIEKDISIWRRK